jgi:trigger factor
LSSTSTLENDPQPETGETAYDGSLDAGREHDGPHQEHEHDHQHGPALHPTDENLSPHPSEQRSRAGDPEPAGIPALNPDCTRELVLDIPEEEVSIAYRNIAGNYRKYARIPGFRAGKVPESVVRRRFAAQIRKEVIDSLLPERFNKGVLELGVKPVGQPRVIELTVDEGAPLHVKVVFEFMPDFSIEGYQSVTVEKPSVEIAEEEFAREMERLREPSATIEPVEEDRGLADGDWAQISYTGRIVGDADSAPVASEDTLLEIGGKHTDDAFTSALRGARPGQDLKGEIIYPNDHPEPSLAGKTVAYNIEVKAIKKRTLPELDDDFARELGDYESFADLETSLREHLANRKRLSVEDETRNRLFAALAERFPFPVPESLIQERIDARLERGLRALAAQGMNTEQMRKLDFARLRAAQRDGAVAEVKASVLLDRIAQVENILVGGEELDRELQLAALQSGEPLETLRARLTQDGRLARIREQLRREKTAHLLYERLPV